MTDSYLVQELAVDFPWIKSVYEESSGWVHLSKKHILNSTSIADSDNRLMSHKISRIDYVSDTLKIEAIECMKEITSLILEFLEGWNHTKRYPPNSIIFEL